MDLKIVGFRLANEEFAFEIIRITEIIRLKEITEIPTAPKFIEGVINLRGKIIPVIDLRKRFNIGDKERTRGSRIMIAEFKKNQLVGIVVDEVTQVINVSEEEVMPPPATITSVGGAYIESIIKQGDKITVMLNIDKIFSDEEQEGLINTASMDIGGEIAESIDS